MKVAFLGPETSFSHDAALKAFPKAKLVEVRSIQNVFISVENGLADAGVVPMENSTEGSVNTTLDLLVSGNLLIQSEVFIDVKHCLLSNSSKGSIKNIYSHPQAFAQCLQWLHKNFPTVELVGDLSTASAAENAAGEEGSAAIASKSTAEKFGLKVLEENIQDLNFNKTRFVVVAKENNSGNGEKTTMFFAVKDRPGALFDCLKGFKDSNVNLTRLESRPSKKGAWDYIFFVEFQGSVKDDGVKSALDELKKHTTFLKILGSYSRTGD